MIRRRAVFTDDSRRIKRRLSLLVNQSQRGMRPTRRCRRLSLLVMRRGCRDDEEAV